MYKGFNRKVKGYFTVEASMLMPVAILLIASFIYLSFFLYNRSILSQDAYILAFRGSIRCDESIGELQSYMEESVRGEMGKKYVGLSRHQRNIKVSKDKIRVENSGEVKSLPGRWYFCAAGEAERICPTECVRKIRLVMKAKAYVTTN